MPGKRVIRISVFQGYDGVVLISTAQAKTGRTPRDSKFVHLTNTQTKRISSMLNDLAYQGHGDVYAHPACGFVWYAT